MSDGGLPFGGFFSAYYICKNFGSFGEGGFGSRELRVGYSTIVLTTERLSASDHFWPSGLLASSKLRNADDYLFSLSTPNAKIDHYLQYVLEAPREFDLFGYMVRLCTVL